MLKYAEDYHFYFVENIENFSGGGIIYVVYFMYYEKMYINFTFVYFKT